VRNRLEHSTDRGTEECGREKVKRMKKKREEGEDEDIIKKGRRAGGKGVFY